MSAGVGCKMWFKLLVRCGSSCWDGSLQRGDCIGSVSQEVWTGQGSAARGTGQAWVLATRASLLRTAGSCGFDALATCPALCKRSGLRRALGG